MAHTTQYRKFHPHAIPATGLWPFLRRLVHWWRRRQTRRMLRYRLPEHRAEHPTGRTPARPPSDWPRRPE